MFFNKRKDRKKDDGIVVLRRPEKNACGGTDATQDTRAPKVIESDDMILFEACSALGRSAAPDEGGETLGYINAFAAPAAKGTFLFLETGEGSFRRGERESKWALVAQSVFPALTKLVNELGLAKDNGFHSTTHGLPENFGGSVLIKYSDGEQISFSNNQSPVLSQQTGREIEKVFKKAMDGGLVAFPDVSDLEVIRFKEERSNGGFTEAELIILPDGTAVNRRKTRYSDPDIFESESGLDGQTVTKLKSVITSYGMLAWEGLPSNGFDIGAECVLTFVFKGGKEVNVYNRRELPDRISRAFFDIQLILTSK